MRRKSIVLNLFWALFIILAPVKRRRAELRPPCWIQVPGVWRAHCLGGSPVAREPYIELPETSGDQETGLIWNNFQKVITLG